MRTSYILKLVFIHWLESIGDHDSAKKILEKGLPTRIYIHGQDSDFKIPFARCIICKRMIVEQGKILIDYSPIPNYTKCGLVWSQESISLRGGEAIVPIDCEFILRGQQNRPEMKECKDKAFTYNAKAIPDTEWSDMLERWNTKVSHEEDMGK